VLRAFAGGSQVGEAGQRTDAGVVGSEAPDGLAEAIGEHELVALPSLQVGRRSRVWHVALIVVARHQQPLYAPRPTDPPCMAMVRGSRRIGGRGRAGRTCSWRWRAVGTPPACSTATGVSSLRRSHTRTTPSNDPLTARPLQWLT
jgi:hypothetical protein